MDRLPDPLFVVFNNLALNSDLEMGVTLTVDGALISGRLVGSAAWFANLIEDPQMGPLHEALLAMNQASKAYEQESGDDANEDFVHLIEARFLSGARAVPSHAGPGMTVRVRLGDVSSWAVGSLKQG